MSTLTEIDIHTANDAAAEHYAAALHAFQTYLGDPVAHIEDALAADAEFVMGHLFRAIALVVTTERRYLGSARRSLEAAEALAGRADARERALTAAVRTLVDGDWDTACRRLDGVLAQFPTDVFTLQTAHLLDFLRGDAVNLRNRVARVLPHLGPAQPGYSYVLGMYAFGLEECNQYPEAEDAGRRAVDMDPQDAWAVHAVTHVMEMQGRVSEGIEWLERRREDWAPTRGPASGFAYHNWWHLGLFHLDRGDPARALAIIDDHVLPSVGDVAMGLLDVTAMLWRLKLLDVDVGDRFERLADAWAAGLQTEPGHYAFNDFHAALTFAAAGRGAELEAVADGAAQAARDDNGANRLVYELVGVPLIDAVRHYTAGRYADTVAALVSVRDTAQRFGGSHAQRDLLTLTLIEAARRAGDTTTARHYLNERLAAKPGSGLGWQLLARLG